MSKIIDSLVQASIDSKDYAGVLLVRLQFDSPTGWIRVNNTNQSIFWDEGSGEEEYLGVGRLGSISTMSETNELGAVSLDLTLSGVPPTATDEAFSDDYRNKSVYIWYATLDKTTYAVQGGATGPVLAFAGLMDFCTVEFGKTCTISMKANSRLADWERPRGGRFNHGYQRQYIDSTDDGFEFVTALQNKEIQWGGRTLADEGGSLNDGSGLPGPPPGQFDPD